MTMEAAGTHVASTDAARLRANGPDSVAQHGEQVASISRHISEGPGSAAAGNEIASQVEGIVAGIEKTLGGDQRGYWQDRNMEAGVSSLRQLDRLLPLHALSGA